MQSYQGHFSGIFIMSVLCFWAGNTFSWAAIWDSSTTLCPVLHHAVFTGLHCSPSVQNWANSLPQLCPLPFLSPNWFLECLCNDLKAQVLETDFLVQILAPLFLVLRSEQVSSNVCICLLLSKMNFYKVFVKISKIMHIKCLLVQHTHKYVLSQH